MKKLIITAVIGALAMAGSAKAQWTSNRFNNPDYGPTRDDGNFVQFGVQSKQGQYYGDYFISDWALLLDIADNGDTHFSLYDPSGRTQSCSNFPHLLKIKSSEDKGGRPLFKVRDIRPSGDIEFHGVSAIKKALMRARSLTLNLRGCGTHTRIDFDLSGGVNLDW